MPTFNAALAQYDVEYWALLGKIIFVEDQVWEMMTLLQKEHLYTGSDGLEKNGRGSHAYGFTSGSIEE